MYEPQAFLSKATGEIHWYLELADGFEELPEDIDDEKCIEIHHKHELDLGKNLVFEFAHQYLPNDMEAITLIFRRKGAYSRFKALLERKGYLDRWYEYESQAQEKALRAWCEDNAIEGDYCLSAHPVTTGPLNNHG